MVKNAPIWRTTIAPMVGAWCLILHGWLPRPPVVDHNGRVL